MRFFAVSSEGTLAHSLCAQLSLTCFLIAILVQSSFAEVDAAFKSVSAHLGFHNDAAAAIIDDADVLHGWQRPDLYPPIFTFESRIPQKLHPGYIFLGPYVADNPGPYIYDNDGVCLVRPCLRANADDTRS